MQALLELMGALYKSRHPALVVVTNGVNFVILQPLVQYYHTSSGTDNCIHVDDGMRLIAHHLLHICSRDGAFRHMTLCQ